MFPQEPFEEAGRSQIEVGRIAACPPCLLGPTCAGCALLVQVVSYIYYTRIIVYLLESTLPYRYIWFSNAGA